MTAWGTGLVWYRSGVPDEEWCPEFYRRLAALRAFRRARRAGVVRRLAAGIAWLRGSPPAGHSPELLGSGGAVQVPIEAIVGSRNADGSLHRPLPTLRRASRETWVRRYLETDPSDHAAVRVYERDTGIYVEGDEATLIALEVLRARGVGLLHPKMIDARAENEPVECRECDLRAS